MSTGKLETTLSASQDKADAALKAAAAVTRELRKAKTGATTGQMRELRRALGSAASLASELSASVIDAQASCEFDDEAYLASGEYAKELLDLAAERGVPMYEEDERLLCYPSLLRVIAGDSVIEIDRRRDRRLRPSVVISHLAAAQQRPPRFRPEPFLESLESGYEFVIAKQGKKADAVARLVDVWAALTLLPGQARDYTKPEFARDLYLLDQSGVQRTRAGRALRWHASSGTRTTGVLTTVARSGQQQRYWGVSFTEPGNR